ncbi:hypothetical protein DFH94DRAFT_685206 [Russula ochroleuca]|uniref:Uncharacterized protein n=1 Tax=Russula ochroleuca TaxID=152965 RepID=A0A9P5MR02_9AGAM|nr:hypothetical protein DFH94DRAFT_685206 [Russula ochroleuca]
MSPPKPYHWLPSGAPEQAPTVQFLALNALLAPTAGKGISSPESDDGARARASMGDRHACGEPRACSGYLACVSAPSTRSSMCVGVGIQRGGERGCGHPARGEEVGVGVGIQQWRGRTWKGVGMCVGTQCECEGVGVDREGKGEGKGKGKGKGQGRKLNYIPNEPSMGVGMSIDDGVLAKARVWWVKVKAKRIFGRLE